VMLVYEIPAIRLLNRYCTDYPALLQNLTQVQITHANWYRMSTIQIVVQDWSRVSRSRSALKKLATTS
jgi:hypothetical protein